MLKKVQHKKETSGRRNILVVTPLELHKPRFATEGPFKQAWDRMKDNRESFWSNRNLVAAKAATDPSIAVYDFKRILGGTEQYKNCKIKEIPARYLTNQYISNSSYI